MDRDEQITQLITKGVETIIPNADFLRKELLSQKKLTIYCGFDPTAPTLHIGHAITLRKLRQFQDLGHQIVFLIGDFTARAGDPALQPDAIRYRRAGDLRPLPGYRRPGPGGGNRASCRAW